MKKVKHRSNNPIARAHSMRGAAGAGKHRNKAMRGMGKTSGKAGRHSKHKKGVGVSDV